MKKELELKLQERFPIPFKYMYCHPSKSCMAFGLEISDYWFQPVWDALEKIEKIVPEDEWFILDQVKSKYASLRVYYHVNNCGDRKFYDKIDKVITMAEKECAKICEQCGKPGKLVGTSWVWIKCEECEKCQTNM